MLGASLAAGMGPRDMANLQPTLAQQSAHHDAAAEDRGRRGRRRRAKCGSTPATSAQKQIETMRAAMQHLEKQKLAAVTAEESYRIEEQQNG